MPLIQPPSDFGEKVEEEQLPVDNSWENHRRIHLFLNVKPWKCECGLTNFGRNLQCAWDKCKSPRPANFKLEQKDG